ncbi:PQQ-dependent sugar dehydrogenase [Bacillus sp. CGMCC 1.16607]|uniref:PQQ-dependent sugar dehydrogenase n=1 Tax=Bacillus sp. CGMCC 1.16607 TaxID=3351842 RepID=UPI003633325E
MIGGSVSYFIFSQPDDKPLKAKNAAIVQAAPTVIAEDLQIPWSIQKLNDTFYLSERLGSIVKVENGQITRQKVNVEKTLSDVSEAGLLGFILDPNFQENQQAYAYYTYDNNGAPFNRVVILTLQDEVWSETKLLLDGIPSGQVHHGGRLKIGPDDKLYITAGDASDPENAQNLQTLAGKILRMNLDGSIPSDNPFPNSYIYSYGHRNPQGLAWDEEGTLYESEHGQSAHDEINRIQAGMNYGWPIIQGNEKQQGMETPIFQTGDVTWAPSGIAYHDGKLYVATLRGEALREVDLATKKSRELITGLGRIRDVLIDGEYVYFISNNTDGRGNPAPNDDKLFQIRLSELK